MNKKMLKYAVIGLLGIAAAPGVMADSNCGMNSNKPCAPEKLIAKEPAYKSMNSNKPQAKGSLSGVSGNDLKVKPQAPKTSRKEPAN